MFTKFKNSIIPLWQNWKNAQDMLKICSRCSPRYPSLYLIVFQSLDNDWVTWTFLIPSRGRGGLTIQKKNVSGPKAMRDFGAFTKAGRMVSMLYDGVVVYTPQNCRHNALPSRLLLGGLRIENINPGPKAALTLMEVLSFLTLIVELILSQGGWY